MEINQLIDELEAMAIAGERKWYTRTLLAGRTVLNADEFYDLLNQLRNAVPAEVMTASQITAQRDQIIEEAHRERQKILDAAREQAQLLISNDHLVLAAQQRAQEIIRQSQIESEAIRAEAEQWARGVIERLENYIQRIAATVEKTKKAFMSSMSTSSPPSRSEGPHTE